MSRVASLGLFALLLGTTGCAKQKDYADAFREQRAAWRDLTEVLASVRDEKSMADAKVSLTERFDQFAKAAAKVQALPRPSAEMLAKLDQEQAGMKRALRDLQDEISRINNKVPGGRAFLEQFKSTAPGLLSAELP